MKPFLSLISLMVVFILSGVAIAQDRQIGVSASGSAVSGSLGIGTPFGVGLDAVVPLGDGVVTTGQIHFDRFRVTGGGPVGHNFRAQGDLRYSPSFARFGEYALFGSAGLDMNRVSFPFGSQIFLSPTLGGGVNYDNLAILQYFYGFPDIISPLDLRTHHVKGDVYIPLGKTKWRGRLGVEYQRHHVSPIQTGANILISSVGVSRTF